MSFRVGDPFPRGRADGTPVKATAPRPWLKMIDEWGTLLLSLCVALRLQTWAREIEVSVLHIGTWRWMLSLPPCSEARKAAWTLGATALMIDRWREDSLVPDTRLSEWEPEVGGLREMIHGLNSGQRAEELLRRCRWHIDDAKIEVSSPTRRPGIPLHVRIYAYSQAVDPEHGGVNFCGVMNDSDRRRVTLAMLDDFVRHAGERKTLKRSDDALIALAPALVETLGASLPEGPWIVTSQDVWRVLAELLLEDAV